MTKPSAIYAVGFWGAPNLGDELLARTLTELIEGAYPGVSVTLYAMDAGRLRSYTGLDHCEVIDGPWPTPEYIARLPRRIRAIQRASIVTIGGGGLIGDRYTWLSVPRYAAEALLATVLGKRFVFVGLGVTTVNRGWLKPLAKWMCRSAAAAWVRDPDAAERYKTLAPACEPIVAPDIAHAGEHTSDAHNDRDARTLCVLNLRRKPPLDPAGIERLVCALVEQYDRVVMLPAQLDDVRYNEELCSSWDEQLAARVELAPLGPLNDSLALIASADGLVAERLHVVLAAAHMGRRAVVIEYEDKVRELLDDLGSRAPRFATGEVDERIAEALRDCPPCADPDRAHELAAGAREAFETTMQRGLGAPKPGLGARLVAFWWLGWLVTYAVARAVPVLIKRLVRGRG